MAPLIFWLFIAILGWAYLLYPLGMIARASRRRESSARPTRPAGGAPPLVASTSLLAEPHSPSAPLAPVSVILAVRDDARWLKGRITNALLQDYPDDKLQVVVACDGSRDRSEAIARSMAAEDARVVVVATPGVGKAAALNAAVEMATGEVLVFAGVRQRFEPGAILRLVEALEEPGVGAAVGRRVAGRSPLARNRLVDRLDQLDTRVRLAESATGSVIGAAGAIYAVRRPAFHRIPPATFLDDAYVPVRIALAGERVVMVPGAVARDVPTTSTAREYRRRVRTLAGDLQLLSLTPELLRPGNPLFARFLSQKLLRVLSPVLFLALVITGFWIGGGLYLWVAVALLAIYAAGLLGLVARGSLLALPATFVLTHAATFHAVVQRKRSR